MNVAAIPSPVDTADVPLKELAGDKALTQQQKVGEVARQFEALLLQQILAETQKTVIHSEFSDDSAAAGIYQSMIVRQLSEAIAKSGTFGLARTLKSQLTRQLHTGSLADEAAQKSVASPAACSGDSPAPGAEPKPPAARVRSHFSNPPSAKGATVLESP